MADIQEENPDLQENWFVKCYVNGMRDSVKTSISHLCLLAS
jgi:hypothetical protein